MAWKVETHKVDTWLVQIVLRARQDVAGHAERAAESLGLSRFSSRLRRPLSAKRFMSLFMVEPAFRGGDLIAIDAPVGVSVCAWQ